MKILLVADLHYTLPQWDWLSATANRFDLVVIAGDLLDITSIVPIEAQITVVRRYISDLAPKAPLLITSGNHDILIPDDGDVRDARWLQEKNSIFYRADGDDFTVDDLYFSLLPWWESDAQRDAIQEQLEVQKDKVEGKRWIWVYHPPPRETLVSWNGLRDFGDAYLPDWIERYKPEMVLGGHIHNAPFYADGSWIDVVGKTFVFNSGKQIGSVPCFTAIDTNARDAIWLSAAEGEKALLKLPLVRSAL